MNVDLTKLNHLCSVARLRSFTRASEALNITQPALSRSIASVEAQLGIRLFDRSRAGVTLTAAGQKVVEEAEGLLLAADRYDRATQALGRGDGGRLTVGMGPLVAALLLAPVTRALLAERPRLHLETEIKAADHLYTALNADRLELFLCGREVAVPSPNHVIEHLGGMELAVIVRGDHPFARRSGVRRADLAGCPLASAVDMSGGPRDGAAIVCDNYYVLRDIVLTTDAVWVAAPKMVENDLAAGRLVTLEVTDWPIRHSEIVSIRLKRRTLSPIAKRLEEQARQILR